MQRINILYYRKNNTNVFQKERKNFNMKSNWIKYVFIIFIIAILIFAVFKIRQDQENSQLEEETSSSEQEQIKEIKVGIARLRHNKPNS